MSRDLTPEPVLHFTASMLHFARLGFACLDAGQRDALCARMADFLPGGSRFSGEAAEIHGMAQAIACFAAAGRLQPLAAALATDLHRRGTHPEELDLLPLAGLARAWYMISPWESPNAGLAPAFAERIEANRSPDGGYSQVLRDRHSTLYGLWLSFEALQNLHREVPEEAKCLRVLRTLKAADDSFAQKKDQLTGSVPATAMASALLVAMEEPADPRSLHWLTEMEMPEGGFLAVRQMPFGDVASTTYALLALSWTGTDLRYLKERSAEFILDHWHSKGGFLAHARAADADPDSSFLALVALGICRG
ncbi:MAG: hypothetical protein RL095_3378 [Verrucomicrobiota bacterium]|jgi:hypothetical protein